MRYGGTTIVCKIAAKCVVSSESLAKPRSINPKSDDQPQRQWRPSHTQVSGKQDEEFLGALMTITIEAVEVRVALR